MKPGPLAAAIAIAFALAAVASTAAQDQPSGHLRIEGPANLSPAVAETIYQNAADEIASGYEMAEYEKARDYLSWRRYNAFPYLSPTHGNRYVNNYANSTAGGYGPEMAEDLPRGAVLAKDSFTVTGGNIVFPAALFVMEKLGEGEHLEYGDWRYVMVLPDGSTFGDSQGPASGQVAFCHTCHAAAQDNDYIFFIPEPFRR